MSTTTLMVKYDNPYDDRQITDDIVAIISTALPYMADNVQVHEIGGE